METSTLTSLLWIAGAIVITGAFFWVKKRKKAEQPDGNTGGGTERPPLPPDPEPEDSAKKVNPNPIKAKKAFIAHLSDFSKNLAALKESFDVKSWTETIIDVNDPDLTGLWEKYVAAGNTPVKWRQLIASWQVKSDTCKSFTCVTNDNMSAYCLPDGGKLTIGVKYKVISPCWVYTSEDNQGNVKKQIVVKGIVVPFES